MIGYVTFGTNNLAKARAFYDAVLPPHDGNRSFPSELNTMRALATLCSVAVGLQRKACLLRQRERDDYTCLPDKLVDQATRLLLQLALGTAFQARKIAVSLPPTSAN